MQNEAQTPLAVAKSKPTSPMTIKELFKSESFQRDIQEIVPKHLTSERLLKTALLAMSKNPKLMQCTPASLIKAVTNAAELGLDFAGNLGSGYLVPYGNEAVFIPGYRGLIDLARRSGQISSISCELVKENDLFVRELGSVPHIKHIPATKDRGKVTGAYACARFTDPKLEQQMEFMDFEQLEAIRHRSRASANGPWKTDTEEMYRKTVIRRLAKYLPLSVEMAKAFDHFDKAAGVVTRPDGVEMGKSLVQRLRDLELPNQEEVTTDLANELDAELQPLEPTIKKTTSKIQWSEADTWRGITDKDRALWAKAFPACDVDRQLLAMDAWLRANPKKAVKSQWAKFITSWLSRAQDRGGDPLGSTEAAPSTEAVSNDDMTAMGAISGDGVVCGTDPGKE